MTMRTRGFYANRQKKEGEILTGRQSQRRTKLETNILAPSRGHGRVKAEGALSWPWEGQSRRSPPVATGGSKPKEQSGGHSHGKVKAEGAEWDSKDWNGAWKKNCRDL
ncbi:MAG: hypothetical protein M1837_001298 [Sclerophora amabilis]|nr:MAG: hypothetical protein M1837_001298 [Sclerophora amabilis]